jgi:tellurite resistance protein
LILSNVHGGHLLPISGFSSVAAVVSARHHWVDLGVAFLSVGLSTWFIFAALLIFRASRHGALPASLSPTRSILAAPPPLAAIAYFEMRGGVIDFWLCALLLLTAVTIIFQVTLMPSFFRLPHSTGNWAFTFPSAAVAVLTMTMASHLQVPGWQLIVIVFAALVTLLVVTNAARSVMKG